MIKCEILTLCEYATVSEGKMTIINVFDHFSSEDFPFSHKTFVAGKISFSQDEGLVHRVHFRLNFNGDYILGFGEEEVILIPGPVPEYPNSFHFTGELRGLKFNHEGLYELELQVNSQKIQSINVYVTREQ